MDAVLTCQITQLLYAEAPQLNFAKVVSDLQKALVAPEFATIALTWDCDDIALLDFETGRIAVGFADDLPGLHSACLTIAVGQPPFCAAAPLADVDYAFLCNALTEHLMDSYPSDAQNSQTINHPLTPELIDRLVEGLIQQGANSPDRRSTAEQLPPAQPSQGIRDMDRLMRKLSSELVGRAPNLIARAIAQATPKAYADATLNQPAFHTTRPLVTLGKAKGLFWHNSKPAQIVASAPASSALHKPASLSELRAVRDALYAADQANQGPVEKLVKGRIAAHARLAVQSLAAFPSGIASAVAEMRRPQDSRIRH